MQRLSSFDANFLYLESPTSHMHVGSLAIYDPSTANGQWGVERVRQVYEDRIHLVPQFRRRIAEVPLQLDHPRWVDDPEFDLGWHIRHIAVPAPGGPDELARLTGELMATQLDRQRPLWEVWVIDAVTGGRFAILSKAHHAAMDGNAGIQMVSAMFDPTPDVAPVPPAPEWEPEAVPGDLALLTRAAGSLAMQPLRAVRATERGLRAVLARRRIAADRHGTVASTLPAGAPKVSFSATLTPERSFAFRTLSLGDVKAVRHATGATVNDVVLAVVGQGLAQWMAERGEAVDRSLVAMVPMSFRGNGADAAEANQLMNMFIRLGTDLADPLHRLAFIAEQTSSAKAQLSNGAGDPIRELSDLSPATVTAHLFHYAAAHHLADRMTPLFNLTMSNLMGSPTPLFLGGALMVANYPLAPIYDGNGLNITVMSYLQQVDVGVVGCPQLTPDLDRIPIHLELALAELVELTP